MITALLCDKKKGQGYNTDIDGTQGEAVSVSQLRGD